MTIILAIGKFIGKQWLYLYSKSIILSKGKALVPIWKEDWNIEEMFIFLAKDIIACSWLQDSSAVG